MIVTTQNHIEGKDLDIIKPVMGNTVRTKHVGNDIMAGFKTIFGGEIEEYSRMLAESRQQALDRMTEKAISLQADAVIGLRFTTSAVMAGAAEILAYGTAVKFLNR
jgi:uncharacterized protein YbjQ (UPF0145 family)